MCYVACPPVNHITNSSRIRLRNQQPETQSDTMLGACHRHFSCTVHIVYIKLRSTTMITKTSDLRYHNHIRRQRVIVNFLQLKVWMVVDKHTKQLTHVSFPPIGTQTKPHQTYTNHIIPYYLTNQRTTKDKRISIHYFLSSYRILTISYHTSPSSLHSTRTFTTSLQNIPPTSQIPPTPNRPHLLQLNNPPQQPLRPLNLTPQLVRPRQRKPRLRIIPSTP